MENQSWLLWWKNDEKEIHSFHSWRMRSLRILFKEFLTTSWIERLLSFGFISLSGISSLNYYYFLFFFRFDNRFWYKAYAFEQRQEPEKKGNSIFLAFFVSPLDDDRITSLWENWTWRFSCRLLVAGFGDREAFQFILISWKIWLKWFRRLL